MEILNEIWVWIVSALGGVSLSGIISAIIYGCLKSGFNKTITKLNVEQIAETATDKGVERVKEVSFKHSIQPLVESELRKITEEANDYIRKAVTEVKEGYTEILAVLVALAAYFDNSIGVPEEAKAKLQDAILKASKGATSLESVESEEVIVESEKTAEKGKRKAENTADIVR